MKADARSSNGTALFKNPCPACGSVRLSDKRRLGKPCLSCRNKERSTHGMSSHRLYKVIVGAISRCTLPKATNYQYYGGRGIYVCDEWMQSKEAFFEWALENGYADNLELDRKDTNGPYAPWNCQFISHQKNSQKRTNARCNKQKASQAKLLLAEGTPMVTVANMLGLPYMSVWHIDHGNTWANA